MRDISAYTTDNDIESVEVNLDQHVDPNVRPSITTSGKPCDSHPEPSPISINEHVLNKCLNDILDGKEVSCDSLSD